MGLLLKVLPLTRVIDIVNQQRYMKICLGILRRSNVAVHGSPLWIAPSVYWDAKSPGIIEVQDQCVISEQVVFLTHDFSLDRYAKQHNLLSDSSMELVKESPLVISEYAFIGIRAVILPGVTVGKGSIVGAGSVVTKDVPPGTVVAGNPAREVSSVADYWDRRNESFARKSKRK